MKIALLMAGVGGGERSMGFVCNTLGSFRLPVNSYLSRLVRKSVSSHFGQFVLIDLVNSYSFGQFVFIV